MSCDPSGRSRTVVTCLLLASAVWIVFGQTIHHDFVNFDDNTYVYENTVVSQGISLKGIVWAFGNLDIGLWHPLTWLSHMLDCQWFGLRPGWHHLTSVLLHAANALLLFVVMRDMTGAPGRSAIVAALFAVHPLHVESVAWVAERKDVLSTFFMLLTLWAYHRYVKANRSKLKRYALVVLFYACGLMSKPMVVTLPLVLLLLDYWPLKRWEAADFVSHPSLWLRLVLEKTPLLILGLLTGVITLHAGHTTDSLGTMAETSIGRRLANVTLSYAGYFLTTFWPINLGAYYPLPETFSSWSLLGASALLLGISVAAFRLARRWPYVVVGWLWYLVTLLPVIGFIQLASYSHADRYTYVPLIGVFVMLVWGAADLCHSRRYGRAALGVVAVVLGGLLVCARAQTAHWRNSISLWTHTLAVAPEYFMVREGLAVALAREGRLNEAIPHFERALQLKPDCAEIHKNLGVALVAQERLNEATQHFERALQLDPNYAEAFYDFGNAMAAHGKLDEAVRLYERALALKTNFASAHYNLANALTRQEKLNEAIQHYESALRLNPHYVEACNNLGRALIKTGRLAEAVRYLEQALRIQPDNVTALINLGNTLTTQGKLNEAIQHLERALQLKPDYAEAHYLLGRALAQQGKPNEAIQHFQEALNLATAQANPVLAEAARKRLESYQPASPQPNTP